jgi:hypothetical protein
VTTSLEKAKDFLDVMNKGKVSLFHALPCLTVQILQGILNMAVSYQRERQLPISSMNQLG